MSLIWNFVGIADPDLDPGSGAFVTPGSGMEKITDPETNNPDHISGSFETYFLGRNTSIIFCGSGVEKIRIRDPG